MSARLIVVLDSASDVEVLELRSEDSLLSFVGYGDLAKQCRVKGARLLDAQRRFSALQEELEREFFQMIHDLAQYDVGGCPVVTLLGADKRALSLWWYLEPLLKRQPAHGDDLFHRIIQAVIVQEVVQEIRAQRVIILSRDGEASMICRRAAEGAGAAADTGVQRLSRRATVRFVRAFADGVGRLAKRSLLGLMSRSLRNIPSFDGRVVGFFSKLPGHWDTDRHPPVRFYQNVPELVNGRDHTNSVHLVWFNGGLSSPKAFQRAQEGQSLPLMAIDSWCAPWDTAVVLGEYVRFVVRYGALRKQLLDEGLQIRGLDVSRLVVRAMDQGVDYLPHYLFLNRALQRLLRSVPIRKVVTVLFEEEAGRTVTHACGQVEPPVRAIGVQHGPVTPGHFTYRGVKGGYIDRREGRNVTTPPVPDRIVIDGEMAKEIMVGGGYPADRFLITGAVRYDRIAGLLGSQGGSLVKPAGEGAINVLVVLGHDDHELLDLVTSGLSDQPGINLQIRPHPLSAGGIPMVKRMFAEWPGGVVIDEGPAYGRLLEANLVIMSYSSLGVEALMLRRPVIRSSPYAQVDLSPLVGWPELVPVAVSPEDLSAHLVDFLNGRFSPDQDILERFVDYFTYRLDGRSATRVVKAIVDEH